MIDYINDPIGTRYGCKYTFTSGTVGTFSSITEGANDGRKVKDPLTILGSYFDNSNSPFPKVIKLSSGIEMATSYIYPTKKTILTNSDGSGTGTMESSREEVDFSKFKKVLSFDTFGSFRIEAIPKDQLLLTKDMLNTNPFVSGINTLTITASNISCLVALTIDNKNWYTWDTTTSSWISVDITQDTSILKTIMCSYTDINNLTATDFSKFTNMTKIGLALLISIEPDSTTGEYDTSISYTVDNIELDYVGTNDETTPSIQHFNFIKVGYTCKGDPILIADRAIQTNISFETIAASGYHNKALAPFSTSTYPMYMRLPYTSVDVDEDSEYDSLIANASSAVIGSKPAENVFNTNIGTITSCIAANTDTDGTDVNDGISIISRGGLSNIIRFSNIDYNVEYNNHGWRPVVEVDVTSFDVTQRTPSAVLPVVTSISITKGQCIACDYEPPTTSNPIGVFKNLGNAAYPLLSDYNNDRKGSFYFVCVGYDKDGYPMLVADRNVVTGKSFNSLLTYSAKLTGYSGATIPVDNYTYRIRFISTPSSLSPASYDQGEWNNIITNEYMSSLSIDDIWHTDKSASFTAAIDGTSNDKVIVRGIEDMANKTVKQKVYDPDYTSSLDSVGFRPLLIVYPQISVDKLIVTPYSAYSKQDTANAWVVQCKVTDKENKPMNYRLVYKGKNTTLSSYSTNETRVISIKTTTSFIPDDSAIDVSIIVVDPDTEMEKTLRTFKIFKEKDYRTSVKRVYGDVYEGWNSDNVDYLQTNPSPKSSVLKHTVVVGSHSYVNVSKFADKIKFNI